MPAKIQQPWDQCQFCMPAKCCTYFALEVDEPEDREDYEAMLWQIAHKGVSFYIEEKKWYMMVDSVCRFLNENNQCSIYETRPDICRKHSVKNCEFTSNAYGFDEHFRTYEELWQYIKDTTYLRIKLHPSLTKPGEQTEEPYFPKQLA